MSRKPAIPKLPPGAPRPKEGWELFAIGAEEVLTKWDLLATAVSEEVSLAVWRARAGGGGGGGGGRERDVPPLIITLKCSGVATAAGPSGRRWWLT